MTEVAWDVTVHQQGLQVCSGSDEGKVLEVGAGKEITQSDLGPF